MNAPKPAAAHEESEHNPVVATFDAAPEEPLTDEERAAFEEAIGHPGPGVSSPELLERLRSKPSA